MDVDNASDQRAETDRQKKEKHNVEICNKRSDCRKGLVVEFGGKRERIQTDNRGR